MEVLLSPVLQYVDIDSGGYFSNVQSAKSIY